MPAPTIRKSASVAMAITFEATTSVVMSLDEAARAKGSHSGFTVRYDEEIVRTIHVKTASANYPVHVGCNLLIHFGYHLRKMEGAAKRRIFILTSPEIWALWGKQFLKAFPPVEQPSVLFFPPGEPNKCLTQVERLATELTAAGA